MCDVSYLCAILGLSVLELGPMYAMDRQTDVRRALSLNATYDSGGCITSCAGGRHNMPPPHAG